MRGLSCVLAALLGCGGSIGGGGPDAAALPGDLDAGDLDAGEPSGGDDASVPSATCKRGVAYNREQVADAPALSQGLGWWYNWSPSAEPAVVAALGAQGLEFVPMVWTGPPRADIDVAALIEDIPAGARYLLGFNEPNFGVQANLTPAQAAAAWPLLEQVAAARGLELVSPALNYCGGNCNETDPFVWLDAFFAACRGCRVDHVAFHWYACDRDALTYILGRFEAYGRPVWLTEFACLDAADTSAAAQEAYMREAVPVLEADAQVFRYAWFIGRSFPDGEPDNLLGAPGQLTPLGDTYAGLAGHCQP